MHLCAGSHGNQKSTSDTLEIVTDIGHLTLVLGTKAEFSGKTASAPNCWAISLQSLCTNFYLALSFLKMWI